MNRVAVNLEPTHGRAQETEFHRADNWYSGKRGHLVIERDGEAVATYRADAVRSVRFSRRPLGPRTTFLRTFKGRTY